jgi:DNA-binding MurR/RpiR family transcriptional regulator
MLEENLFDKINTHFDRLSKSQKKLATFLNEEYDRAAFMTAAGIGKEVGVSESTVVRFGPAIGYESYQELRQALKALVQNRIHEAPQIDIDNENISRREVLEQVFHKDMENIAETMEHIDHNAFDVAVDLMMTARKVYIVGIRNSAPLAWYLGYYLKLMLDDVRVIISDNSSDLFEEMLRINEEDCVVGISFPRYSMQTLKAMEFANSRNVRVITITDNVNSPMNLYSSCNLVAKSEMTAAAESLTAPMTMVNAILTYLMAKCKKKLINRLEMLEDICNEYAVAGNDDMNMVDDSDMAELQQGNL